MKSLGQAETEAESLAEAALSSCPAWQGRAVAYAPAGAGIVSPSHRGVDAQQWKVAVDGAEPAVLLKVFHDDQKPFIDAARSHAATAQAAGLGITPRPLFCTDRALAVELLPSDWRTAAMDSLRDAGRMEKVIALKRRMHASTPLSGAQTVFERLRALKELMLAAGVAMPADLWWLQAGVDDIETTIAAAGYDTVPAHADGLASNVMYTDGGDVLLVDFDEARNVDPYYELGILLNEAFVFDSEMLPALEIFDGAVRQQSLARCRLYAVADDLYWGLWAAMMDAQSPRGGIEFQKYSNWRLLRCRMALRHPGFEERLRQV